MQQAEVDEARRPSTRTVHGEGQVAGTVEQISVAEGHDRRPGSPHAAVCLIPAGPRVVRAEVEAEFAHRVDASAEAR